MRLLKTAIISCPRFLHWLVISSFLILIVKFLWLDSIPAFFPKAEELGNLTVDILVANIAGYVFYILSSEIPKAVDKKFNGKKIMRLAEGVAHNVTGFLQMAYYTNKSQHPELEAILKKNTVTKEIVNREFSLISPNDFAPMVDGALGNSLTWLGAMAKHDFFSKDYISKLWRLSPFIDAELSGLLLEIEDSRHSHGMQSLKDYGLLNPGAKIQNTDLTTWTDNYYECYDVARRLLAYCQEYRKNYGIEDDF